MDFRDEGSPVDAGLGPDTSPTVLGRLLWPLSVSYGVVASWRRRRGMARARRLPVPVVSVGNITCGGTGKTPTVEMIVRDLLERGRRPAVLSRGYRAGLRSEDCREVVNDEYLVLAENLDGVPQFPGRERFHTGTRAIGEGADVIVLDDGFQHVRLVRDLDLVLLDSLRPFDNGYVLPAGLLREPTGALRHADLIAITRCDLVGDARIARIRERVEQRFGKIPVVLFATQAIGWEDLRGRGHHQVEALEGCPVAVLHSIGNVAAFHATLDRLVVDRVQDHGFPDHHTYRPAEIASIAATVRGAGLDTVVMTQKDSVKLRGEEFLAPMQGLRWLALRIRQSIRDGRPLYEAALDRALGVYPPSPL